MAIQLHVSAPYQFISVNAFVKYRQRQHKLLANGCAYFVCGCDVGLDRIDNVGCVGSGQKKINI
jgi:hypothetical protein